MKRLLFLLVGLALISNAQAQLSLSKDTAFMDMEPQAQVKGLISVLNPNEVKYHWTLLQDDVKAHYPFIEMCDCKDCFGNKAYPITDSCIESSGQVKTFSVDILAGDSITAGLFIIEVENDADPTDKATMVFKVGSGFSPPGSVNKQALALSNVSIMPNPSTGVIRVETDKFESALVYDITGSLVYEANDSEMNLSHLPKGLYLLEVTADQLRSSHKITLK